MGAPDLRNRVAEAGQPLVRIQTLARAARFESARIEDDRSFLVGPAETAERRNLRNTVLVEALVVVAYLAAIHLGGILEDVGEADVGVAEDEFVRHARAEHVRDRGGDGIRFVLAEDRRRVGNLIVLAPPQTHRELLGLALQVVTDEQLGAVADVVIHATQPLHAVLVEVLRLHVVEAAVGVRIGVRLGVELHQGLHVGVKHGLGDDPARIHRHVGRRERSGRSTGSRDVSFFGDFGRGEVAADFAGRRHRGTEQAGVENLIEIFVAGEEEQLVAVPVELRAGNQDRSADRAAGIVILILRLGLAILVEEPVVGVHRVVARVEESRTVEVLAARFRDRTDDRRAFLVFRAEVRSQHFELGNHIRVRIHRGGAVATGVGNVRAVRRDVERVARQPVVGVGVVQRALASAVAVAVDADRLARETGLVTGAVRNSEARHDLNEFRRVAADGHKILQFFAGQSGGFFAGVDRHNLVDRARNFDGFRRATHFQSDVDVAFFATAQGDAGQFGPIKAFLFYRQFVRARWNRDERVVAFVVRNRVAQ